MDDSESSQDDDGVQVNHEHFTSPILTQQAYVAVDGKRTIGQYGVLGKILSIGSVSAARSQIFHIETLIQLEGRR